MTALNKQALREAAEKAASDSWGYDRDEFNEALTPATVLALLDELEAAEKRIAELEARTVSVKLPDGWHFEECETEGCQNCALFSVGKAANNLHLCEACAKAPLNSRFTKTVLPKRLPFKLTAGIKLEVGE